MNEIFQSAQVHFGVLEARMLAADLLILWERIHLDLEHLKGIENVHCDSVSAQFS